MIKTHSSFLYQEAHRIVKNSVTHLHSIRLKQDKKFLNLLTNFYKINDIPSNNTRNVLDAVSISNYSRSNINKTRNLNSLLNIIPEVSQGSDSIPMHAPSVNQISNNLLHSVSESVPMYSTSVNQITNNIIPTVLDSNNTQVPSAREKIVVKNLSSKIINHNEYLVLAKGLNFTPTQNVNHFSFGNDIVKFCRNLRWREFWHSNQKNKNNNNNNSKLHNALTQFRPYSNKEPPPLPKNHPVEIFITILLNKVTQPSFLNDLKPTSNLSMDERAALDSLSKDKSIVILPADKGSTTVILNKTDYVTEGLRQLRDETFYKKLSRDPNKNFAEKIKKYIEQNKTNEKLSDEDVKTLIPDPIRTPNFYLLPKIHKPNNPGRPIVASYNSPTERISAFVDYFLQPYVKKLSSHIKDSYHFIDILKNTVIPKSDDLLFVTIDAVSLYTNIPHNLGLEAISHFLDDRPHPQIPSTDFLCKLAEFVLTCNAFSFEDEFYLQTKGTAMGTRMAPSYANLFMGLLEKKFLHTQNLKPILWYRFIDDIIMIWPHGQATLTSFLNDLNNFGPLNFTHTISKSQITFLDVDLLISDGTIKTAIHIKPTNKEQYLHFESCHPFHTKRSIPYSMSIRGHRLVNNKENLDKYLVNLKQSLLERKYPAPLLEKHILNSEVKYTPKPKISTNLIKNTNKIFLSTTYFPGAEKLRHIINDLFPIISNDASTKDLLDAPPILSFRRPPNIRSILNTTKNKQNYSLGNNNLGLQPCGRPRCKTCPLLDKSDFFTSPNTLTRYKVPLNCNCNSRNVIYQLLCRTCNSFYIGETTTPLNIRLNNHRDSVGNGSQLPISLHARAHNLTFDECFKVKIIKCLGDNAKERDVKSWEMAFIYILGACKGSGLNRQN